MPLLLQASDLHFGKPHDPVVAEAFMETAHRLAPDMIVLAGDFTQRAKISEFEAARAFIDRLPDVPTVVTPGNHDVPLYRVFERFFKPFANYRRFIEDQLDSVTRIPGVTAVALNTAAPRTAIVNGTVREHQLGLAQAAFDEAPSEDVKVAVLHHHMAMPGDWSHQPALPIRERVLTILEDAGVDLILSGHLHRGFIARSSRVYPESRRDVLIVHSGTATSTRGRGREKGRNSFNLIATGLEHLTVEHFMYMGGPDGFRSVARHVSPRLPNTWLEPSLDSVSRNDS